MNEQKAIEQGNQAKLLLEHPLFVKIVNDYETRLIASWKFSEGSYERENIWLEYNTLKKVITEISLLWQKAHELLNEREQEHSE